MSKSFKTARWGTLMVAAALTGTTAVRGAPAADGPRTESLTVNAPRPLAEVADQIEKRFGVPITYEDPPYLHSSDIADLRSQPAAKGHVDRDHPTWIPRFARIELTFELSDPHDLIDDLAAALEQAIKVHESNGNPGSFRLDRQGDALGIVPVAAKGPDGQQRQIKPLLDTEISLPEGTRPGSELLELIRAELGRRSGFKVHTPYNVGIVRPVESPGVSEPARSALRRLLDAQPTKFTWRLFYDPPLGEYFLNVLPLRDLPNLPN